MNIVFFIHCLIFLAALVAPVVGNRQVLVIYAYAMPLTMFHWLTNNDKCCLTQLEAWWTGKKTEDAFLHRVFAPIYTRGNVADKKFKFIFLWLWLITMYRLVGLSFPR
jgi:hypothetical protein